MKEHISFWGGIITGALIVSALFGIPLPQANNDEITNDEEPYIAEPQVVAATTTVVKIEEPIEPIKYTPEAHITAMATKYGQNEFLAKEIMRCEGLAYAISRGIPPSEARHYNYTASGTLWSIDVGRWQINDYYHAAAAKKLGLDIYDDYDNIEYGFYLLKTQGTAPWSASRYCWDA